MRISRRTYDQATVEALTVLRDAADRICAKRLKRAIPTLLDTMERHARLTLSEEMRQSILTVSAATIDRLLAPLREVAKQGRRRVQINTPLRKSIAVRTFTDWNDPPPGFLEMVAHCVKSVAGAQVHSLAITDIAFGWTEAVALPIREQTLVTAGLEHIRLRLSFPMVGLDVDSDSAFINETLMDYCKERRHRVDEIPSL